MQKKNCIFFLILLFVTLLTLPSAMSAKESALLSFNGYLGKEAIEQAKKEIQSWKDDHPQKIFIVIDSQSGDLSEVLDLAKDLYEEKLRSHSTIVIHIQDSAIGPSAAIAFLADTMTISPSITWGAIAGRDVKMPTNILRAKVKGLIADTNAHRALLEKLADAMCDPSVPFAQDGIVHEAGGTLVLNQIEVKTLGLTSSIVEAEEYLNKFPAPPVSSQLPEKSFDENLRLHLLASKDGKNSIGRIVIDDRTNGINQSTWLYVNAALAHYKRQLPACIILELNTPGGEVFAAQRISDALKEMDAQYGCPVIAYINNWAISAGAMLAYSCRYIVIAKDASMGAAEPVIMGPGETGMQEASEKINSALRTDFANRAKYFGRNPYIAEAMVDKDVILVLRHKEVIKLDSEDQIVKTGMDPDTIISPKGKLLTLDADQMISLGVADQMLLPEKREPISPEEEASGSYPLSKSLLSEVTPLRELSACTIDTFRMDWQTRFLAFLSTPVVSSLLFLAMMVGFYIEISTPGFGVAGTIAITALFLILLTSFAMEAVHWLEPLLFLFGAILLALEVFLFPTAGILGILGALFMTVGLLGMMLPGLASIRFDGKVLNAAGEYVLSRLGWLSGSLLLACVLIAILSRYITPRFKMMHRLILQDTKMLATGEHEMKVYDAMAVQPPKIGALGEVVITLRPAGRIRVNGNEYDALSSGAFLDVGKKVYVVAVEGEKIMVEEAL